MDPTSFVRAITRSLLTPEHWSEPAGALATLLFALMALGQAADALVSPVTHRSLGAGAGTPRAWRLALALMYALIAIVVARHTLRW